MSYTGLGVSGPLDVACTDPNAIPNPNAQLSCICRPGFTNVGNQCVLPVASGIAALACRATGGAWDEAIQTCLRPSQPPETPPSGPPGPAPPPPVEVQPIATETPPPVVAASSGPPWGLWLLAVAAAAASFWAVSRIQD